MFNTASVTDNIASWNKLQNGRKQKIANNDPETAKKYQST